MQLTLLLLAVLLLWQPASACIAFATRDGESPNGRFHLHVGWGRDGFQHAMTRDGQEVWNRNLKSLPSLILVSDDGSRIAYLNPTTHYGWHLPWIEVRDGRSGDLLRSVPLTEIRLVADGDRHGWFSGDTLRGGVRSAVPVGHPQPKRVCVA